MNTSHVVTIVEREMCMSVAAHVIDCGVPVI